MATSLYDLSVGSYLQTLGGLSVVLGKGLTFCTENRIDTNVVLETRLYPNMLPFRFQVDQVCHHSNGAIAALKTGTFEPFMGGNLDYSGLQALVEDTIKTLNTLAPDEVNSLEGNEVTFVNGNLRLPFTAPNFIMSFSLPNFYFHATTAYDILRSMGVHLEKRHYMGRVRFNQ